MDVESVNKNNFNNEVLDQKGTVIVDFYAPWCGPCHMQAPIMENLASDLQNNAKVVKVNIDENQELASKYGILSIPTIKIFKDGKEVKTLVGLHDKESLIDALKVA